MASSASDWSLPDPARLQRFSRPGPRYTSYPTAPVFDESFGPEDYGRALANPARANAPLSLYFHIPFCENVCLYCGCNVIYTANHRRAAPYLELLRREMDLVQAKLDPARPVDQLHLGGGTPTFLAPEELRDLCDEIRRRFRFSLQAELSIELDPRVTNLEHIDVLAEAGFNRASLGVQDLDPRVQAAIRREQPAEEVFRFFEILRGRGFRSLSADLIYGLPHQSAASFRETIEGVLRFRPDRLSLFQFAYLPELKKHQQRLDATALPSAEERLAIFFQSSERLREAGYEYIGMDHFALPQDELACALRDGSLHRNFQGYTTRGACDLIGFGLTSIGEIGEAFAQNAKEMAPYEEAIRAGRFATQRGLVRGGEDRLRARVIRDLLCRFAVDLADIETEFGIDFRKHFSSELNDLQSFADEGFLEITSHGLRVLPDGRFVIRNICMAFDAYLPALRERGQRFSKTV